MTELRWAIPEHTYNDWDNESRDYVTRSYQTAPVLQWRPSPVTPWQNVPSVVVPGEAIE